MPELEFKQALAESKRQFDRFFKSVKSLNLNKAVELQTKIDLRRCLVAAEALLNAEEYKTALSEAVKSAYNECHGGFPIFGIGAFILKVDVNRRTATLSISTWKVQTDSLSVQDLIRWSKGQIGKVKRIRRYDRQRFARRLEKSYGMIAKDNEPADLTDLHRVISKQPGVDKSYHIDMFALDIAALLDEGNVLGNKVFDFSPSRKGARNLLARSESGSERRLASLTIRRKGEQ